MGYNVFVRASGASSSLTVDELYVGGTWNVAVKAVGASSSLTVDGGIAPPAVVGTLSNLVATLDGGPGSTTAVLTWDYATVTDDSLTGFEVWVGTVDSPNWGEATGFASEIESIYLYDLSPGTNYIYMRAVGDGVYSDPVSDSVEVEAIGTPSNLTVVASEWGPVILDTAWDYATVPGDAINRFEIYVGTSPTPIWSSTAESSLTTRSVTVPEASYEQLISHPFYGTVYLAVKAATASGLESEVVTASVFIPVPGAVRCDVMRHGAGRLMAGSWMPSVGITAEVRAVGTAWGQAVVSWTPVNAVRFAVYVDAELVTITTASEVVVPGLASGAHNIAVIAIGETETPQAIRPEYEEGDQGLLQWDAVTDPDLAKYRVGSAEVAMVTISPATLNPTGTGTGRLQVGGRFTGGAVNEDMTLTVAAGNVLEYSIKGQTGAVLMLPDTAVQLPYGAEVTPLDELAAYEVGDTYSLPLMVDTRILTAELARGTHTFEIKAVTTMDVEGAAVSVDVFIPNPDAEGTATLSVDGDGAPVMDFNLSGADAAGIYVYTNIDVDGTLMDRINELSPTVQSSSMMGELALPWDGTTPGELRVMVGIVTTWGHVIRQLEMMTLTLPEPDEVFGVPEIVELEQVGTAVRATIVYTWQENDAAEIIQVTRDGVSTYVDSAVLPSGEPGDTVEVIVTVDGADPDGTLVSVTAQAANAGATIFGIASEAMEITLDLHVADAPDGATGVPA